MTSSATRPGGGWIRRALLVAGIGLATSAGMALAQWWFGWARQPGALQQSVPLEASTLLAQPLVLPGSGLDRLGLVVSKQGDPWPATLQLILLDGDSIPRDQRELTRRTRAEFLLRVGGDADRRPIWRPLENALSTDLNQHMLLLVVRRDARSSSVRLWLGDGQQTTPSTASLLRAGPGGELQATALGSGLALSAGSVPSRGLRQLAWLGLWVYGALVLVLVWLGRAPAEKVSGATDVASPGDRRLERLADLVVLLALVLVVVGTARTGVAWDEQGLAAYGGFLVEYYARWFPDAAIVDHYPLFNLHLYGGAFELLLAALDPQMPGSPYDIRHLLTGLCGVAGLLVTRGLARRLGGPRVALWAVILLAMLPSWNGHWLNNTKDLPFAVGCTWSLLVLVDLVQSLPEAPPRRVLHLGLAMGLSMGVRVAGLMLPGLLFLVILGWCLVSCWKRRELGSAVRLLGRLAGTTLLPATLLAYALMVFLWPWAQQAVLSHPLQALFTFGGFSDYTDRVLVAGQSVLATEVPRSYQLLYLVAKLPELHLALLVATLLVGGLVFWRDRTTLDRRHGAWAVVAGLVVLPLLAAWLLRPTMYDGLRQSLFVLPASCVLAAGTLDGLLVRLWSRSRSACIAPALLLLVAVGDLGLATARLFPYQYIYYNHLVGGVEGAQDRYELDYWGLCYREAVQDLQQVLEQRAVALDPQRPVRVASCGERSSSEVFFPTSLAWVRTPESADFVLTHRRQNCPWQDLGHSVGTVQRMGVRLCDLREVTP
ncbi:MAG: hypothetical protein ABIJ09_11085 [Pseudomonadota bacterium]